MNDDAVPLAERFFDDALSVSLERQDRIYFDGYTFLKIARSAAAVSVLTRRMETGTQDPAVRRIVTAFVEEVALEARREARRHDRAVGHVRRVASAPSGLLAAAGLAVLVAGTASTGGVAALVLGAAGIVTSGLAIGRREAARDASAEDADRLDALAARLSRLP